MMGIVIRNPEIKAFVIKLFVLWLLMASIILILTGYCMDAINRTIISQNAALLGVMVNEYPEVSDEIVEIAVSGASKEDIDAGREILRSYGYGDDMDIKQQVLFKGIYPSVSINLTIAVMLGFIPVMILLLHSYSRIYEKVRLISTAAEEIVEDRFDVVIPEEGEGDFGILAHRFNQMADRLKNTVNKLKEEKVYLKNVISDISHQLKTPLSALITFNELMIMKKDMDGYKREEFLNKSCEQLEHMEWLVVNLLNMARMEAGAITFKKNRVRLLDVAGRAVSSLETMAAGREQKVEIVEEHENIIFTGDEEWLTESVSNIIKNCIEHTGQHGAIRIGIKESKLFSRLSITDNGVGIKKKDLPHIFDRFYRSDKTGRIGNTGIGLALSKLIVEGQGGTITAKSREVEGSEFTLTFPKVNM